MLSSKHPCWRHPGGPTLTPVKEAAGNPWKERAAELNALNRAALAIADDLDLDRVLTTILATARKLARSRYGALGVPDGRGGFDRFLTVGITDAQARRIGDLPRYHGVLGILLQGGSSIRMTDIRDHPSFSWYPEEHPILKDFLGVPIRHRGEVMGEIYLSGARGGRFTARDQELVEMLAIHAGIALTTARLYRQAQELAVLEERERVARELHDAVSQTLFSMVYEARAATLRAAAHPGAAVEALGRMEEQATAALAEMRGLVYGLRPKSLERDGLATTLADHVEALRRSHDVLIESRLQPAEGLSIDQETALLRIAQEALQNSLKHAEGAPIAVSLRHSRAGTELSIVDSGPGFDLDQLPRTVRTMGLSTMSDRAAAIRAALDVTSGAGRGTSVRVFLPADQRA
jgi:signal transduction histidine kinase